uniref:Peptidase S1 domain-containing protein n=1 Tax=Oryctolagus cuniculus TaxID=9986 RepID=A0A5F9DPA7_RABIT
QMLQPNVLLSSPASGSALPFYNPSSRVVNGEDAEPHSWPWQVLLLIEQGDWLYIYCGGTLIKPNWVLTAAHCISNEKYWVALGEHDITISEGPEQFIPVEKIYVHPLYNNDDWWKDRAGDKGQGASVPRSPPGQNHCGLFCVPAADGPTPDKLQQGLLPVVDYAHCSQPDWWGSAVKEIHVCAGGANVAGCYGDSGGPLNCPGVKCKWEVNGVVSFGPEYCNTPKKPTVFTRVSAFIDWIEARASHSLGATRS